MFQEAFHGTREKTSPFTEDCAQTLRVLRVCAKKIPIRPLSSAADVRARSRRWLCVGGTLAIAAAAGCRRSSAGVVTLVPSSAPVNFGAPGIAALEPPLPPFEQGMMDHSHRAGWAADGSEFGYCVQSGGSGGTTCTFSTISGKVMRLSDFDRSSGEPDAGVTAELERRISLYAVRGEAWPYARDVVLTWEVLGAHAPAGAESKPAPVLRVGARLRTAKEAAWPIRITAREFAYTIHPEAIALSAGGRALAVLSHEFAGEFSDHFELRFIETRKLASQAYNAAGLELQRAGAHARAAELFRAAAALETRSPQPPSVQ